MNICWAQNNDHVTNPLPYVYHVSADLQFSHLNLLKLTTNFSCKHKHLDYIKDASTITLSSKSYKLKA